MINKVKSINGLVLKLVKDELIFNEDITYITGHNGSGKSVLLQSISHACFVDDNLGGFEKPLFWRGLEDYQKKNKVGDVLIEWDGSEVFSLSNSEIHNNHLNLGYEMGSGKRIPQLGKYIDKRKQYPSNGMMNQMYFDDLKNITLHSNIKDVDYRKNERFSRDYEWERFVENYKGGKPTLLLDEIDSHLSVNMQHWFHTVYLPELAVNFQVICVSHSVFLDRNKMIGLDDSFNNDIELIKNFLQCKNK